VVLGQDNTFDMSWTFSEGSPSRQSLLDGYFDTEWTTQITRSLYFVSTSATSTQVDRTGHGRRQSMGDAMNATLPAQAVPRGCSPVAANFARRADGDLALARNLPSEHGLSASR
jgi:hypothetical protein